MWQSCWEYLYNTKVDKSDENRRVSFPPSLKETHSSIDQRRLNYTSAEQCGYLVLWYTKESLCDSFTTFQKQDYFILSSQTASRMKDLSIIFYLLPAFNSPHSFSRPSFVQSLSPQRHLFLSSLTFKAPPPDPSFWCNESCFQSVTLGWKTSSQPNPILKQKRKLMFYYLN